MTAKLLHRTVVSISIAMMLGCAASSQQPQTPAPQTVTDGWQNVSIGGGGFVTGIYTHPRQRDLVYIRTDVGGFYRWNGEDKSWIALNDSFTLSESNYYGGEALAVDPNNPDIVYIAAGKYTKEWAGNGTIFKSSDRGQTWTKSNLNLPMGGNEAQRWAGERLVVNPFNSDIIFFGSRSDGLWKSSDAGATWTKVTTFSPTLTPEIGILSIAFDKQVSGLIYANVYGDGIYQSTDTGVTWSKMAGSPIQAQRMAVASNSVLYVTHQSGVSKYANGNWKTITPNSKQPVFNALAINPANPNNVIVALGQSPSTKIYTTTNGGATWIEKRASLNHTVPWWKDSMFSLWNAAIEFDPSVPGRVWMTNAYGIWRTDNINASPVVWTNYQQGHEEVVTFALAAPPKGAVLLSGVADVDGFYHNQGLNAYPSKKFSASGPEFDDTYSIAYSERDPLRMVRVGGIQWKSSYTGATSTDGGLTWSTFASFPLNMLPLRVAVSATNPDVFVVVNSKAQPLRTIDRGASWTTIAGLPDGPEGPWYWNQPLVADKVDGDTFYYYDSGKVYRSTDAGASFSVVNSSLPTREWDWYAIKTVPEVKDELWISLNWNGLFRSIDGGKTFSKLASVERAYLFAFGKPQPGSTNSALYLYGNVAGMGEGIFSSFDNGQTWTSIGSPENPIGNEPNAMEASRQQFGLVFIGTNGRGIYYKTLDGSGGRQVSLTK